MRSIPLIAACTAVCLLAAALALGAPAPAEQPADPRYPLDPGRIAGVPLACFAGDALQTACEELTTEHEREAENAFEAALRKDSGDLVAWVGLMQSNTKRWPAELRKARGAAKGAGQAAAAARFRLGVLLFYQWASAPAPAVLTETEPEPMGRAELQEAWRENKATIVGMALIDTHMHNNPKVSAEVVDQLLLGIAGPDTQKAVRAAVLANWDVAPPPVPSLTLPKLRELWGVVRLARVEALERPRTRVKQADGTVELVLGPLPPPMARKAQYMQQWRTAIETELRRQGVPVATPGPVPAPATR